MVRRQLTPIPMAAMWAVGVIAAATGAGARWRVRHRRPAHPLRRPPRPRLRLLAAYAGDPRFVPVAPREVKRATQLNARLGQTLADRIARDIGLRKSRVFTAHQYAEFITGKGVGGKLSAARLVEASVRILTNTIGRPMYSVVDGHLTPTVLASYGLWVNRAGLLESPANTNAPTRKINKLLVPGGYLGTWCRANGAETSLRQLYRSAYTSEVIFGNRSQHIADAAQLVPNTKAGVGPSRSACPWPRRSGWSTSRLSTPSIRAGGRHAGQVGADSRACCERTAREPRRTGSVCRLGVLLRCAVESSIARASLMDVPGDRISRFRVADRDANVRPNAPTRPSASIGLPVPARTRPVNNSDYPRRLRDQTRANTRTVAKPAIAMRVVLTAGTHAELIAFDDVGADRHDQAAKAAADAGLAPAGGTPAATDCPMPGAGIGRRYRPLAAPAAPGNQRHRDHEHSIPLVGGAERPTDRQVVADPACQFTDIHRRTPAFRLGAARSQSRGLYV